MESMIRWLPWGGEAFEQAKKEQKPVFLHIGFPSCHWCHVMERESFQDPDVAKVLNEAYICIDVDREKRPDVDAVYMAACQSMTGQGGWPLTALLTPEQQPFYIATYLPKDQLLTVLHEAEGLWMRRRDRVAKLGAQLRQAVRQQFEESARPVEMTERHFAAAVQAFSRAFDKEWGGMGIAPKFPMPHTLVYLLRHHKLTGDETALAMAETTLLRMCEGGIFDHVGGGFMRYSTDRKWEKPHYEKMLMDNALLVEAYTEAYLATETPVYRLVAERTIEYIARDMTHPEGGFFASQDADAEGLEGAYYYLARKELLQVLGKEDGPAYAAYYGITEGGVPMRIGYEGSIETQRMAAMNEKLRAYRAERMPSGRDDKILTAWNGRMIAALADAYSAFGETKYLEMAQRAAQFAADQLQRPDGDLAISWQEGVAQGEGLLDDYANMALGALALYRATLEPRWLTWAVGLARELLERFEDKTRGGFYMTAHQGETLIARPKETYDGAHPSGNATALSVLVTLAMLDIGEGWVEAVERQWAYLSGIVADAPVSHMASLMAAQPLVYPVTLLEAHADEEANEALLQELTGAYAPLLYLKATKLTGGRPTWRVCRGTTCLAPFETMEDAVGEAARN